MCEGAHGEEGMALVAGTDAGWLLFYSLAGDLLHKQVADGALLFLDVEVSVLVVEHVVVEALVGGGAGVEAA